MNMINRFFYVQHETHRFSWLMVLLLFFYSLILTSAVWTPLGVGAVYFLPVLLAGAAFFLLYKRRNLKIFQIVTCLILFTLALVPAVYWLDLRLVTYPLFFFIAILLLGLATVDEISIYIDLASWFLFILLIGAVVGFFIALAGTEPIFEFANRDGRPNYLFYTTFTNAWFGNFIRPSGIYDEPGAFSLFICATAYMRHVTGRDFKLTWLLLGLGFITLSLAHLIFVIVFMAAERPTVNRLAAAAAMITLFAAGIYATGIHKIIDETLVKRVAAVATEAEGEETRVVLTAKAYEVLTSSGSVFLLGAGSDCTYDMAACKEKWGYFGGNPLTPMASQGLLIAWPYYFFLIAAFFFLFRGRRNWAFFAVGLLFLQRPSVLHFGYSFIAVVTFWLQLNRNIFRAVPEQEDENGLEQNGLEEDGRDQDGRDEEV